MKNSQIKFVEGRLNDTGEISRNECLRNYISRLAAVIAELKRRGWQFDTESRITIKPDGSKGKDFVYKVTTKGGLSN